MKGKTKTSDKEQPTLPRISAATMHRVGVLVNADTLKRLKTRVLNEGTTMQDFIHGLILESLKRK
jgi:hypothetical protein